jgi:hypothetical protein
MPAKDHKNLRKFIDCSKFPNEIFAIVSTPRYRAAKNHVLTQFVLKAPSADHKKKLKSSLAGRSSKSPANFFFRFSPKIACQAPKPPKPHKQKEIELAF